MDHGNLERGNGIHSVVAFAYLNEAGRLSGNREDGDLLTGTDVGKVAWQQDTSTYWLLTSVDPLVWSFVGVTVNGSPVTGAVNGATMLSTVTNGIATLDVNPDRVLAASQTTTIVVESLASGVASTTSTIAIAGIETGDAYCATIGVRATISRQGAVDTVSRAELIQDVSITTTGSVTTVVLLHPAQLDKSKCVAIPASAIMLTIAAVTGGFTITITQTSGNACRAVLQIRLADLVATV